MSLKIQEETLNVAISEKKEKRYSDKSYIPTREGHLPSKNTLDIDYTGKPVVQCDVPVAKKYVLVS